MALEFVYIDTATPELKSVASATMRGQVLLETITNAVADEFDFNSIDQSYDDLIILARNVVSSEGVATNDNFQIFFNSDLTAGNYFMQEAGAQGGLSMVDEDTDNILRILATDASLSGKFTDLEIRIPKYAANDAEKYARIRFVNYDVPNNIATGLMEVLWEADDGTNPITRIRLRCDGHDSEKMTGIAKLYGVKGFSVGVDPS